MHCWDPNPYCAGSNICRHELSHKLVASTVFCEDDYAQPYTYSRFKMIAQ
jgi:hypothetical protein